MTHSDVLELESIVAADNAAAASELARLADADPEIAAARALDEFNQWLFANGRTRGTQRQRVARVFFAAGRPLTCAELLANSRKVWPRMGYATVWRTLRALVESGLATAQPPAPATTYAPTRGVGHE